jgi:serine/threonine protein kinase
MDIPGSTICDKYKIVKKIGAGSFGEVYEGYNTEDHTPVAIKFESIFAKVPQLLQEARIIKICEGTGIPRVYYHGTEGRYNVMVMELLGPTLIQCLKRQTPGFSLKTVLQIGMSMLQRIHYIHSKNFIHRDIKPENYVIGKNKKSHLIYLIDFGLAKRYRDSKSHQHIPFRENKSLTGTARYASINSHMGLENSRRDDLESICYVMIYLLKKALPWQGIAGITKQEKYRRIMDSKMNTKLDLLCKDCPPEFKLLLTYSRALRFEEKPDYEYMKGLLSTAAEREKIRINNVYDWNASRASVSGVLYTQEAPIRRKRTHSIRRRDKRSASQAVGRASVIVTVAGDNESLSPDNLGSDKCSEITTNKIDLPQFQNRASIMNRRLTFNAEILIRKNFHKSPKCKLF